MSDLVVAMSVLWLFPGEGLSCLSMWNQSFGYRVGWYKKAVCLVFFIVVALVNNLVYVLGI